LRSAVPNVYPHGGGSGREGLGWPDKEADHEQTVTDDNKTTRGKHGGNSMTEKIKSAVPAERRGYALLAALAVLALLITGAFAVLDRPVEAHGTLVNATLNPNVTSNEAQASCQQAGFSGVNAFKTVGGNPVGTFNLPTGGTVTIALTTNTVNPGPPPVVQHVYSFTFSASSGAAAVGVVIKAGDAQYTAAIAPPEAHFHVALPVGVKQTGSHIVLCYIIGTPDIEIVKTPDSGTLTVGDKIQWTIVVSNDGTATANGVTASDTLQPPGFDFTIVSEGLNPTFTGGSACTVNAAVDPNTLSCNIGSLAAGASYRVIVESTTAIPVGSSLCGEDIINTASANSTDGGSDSDTGTQSVACGAIEVNKVVKDATTPTLGDTKSLGGVGFTLFEGADAPADGTEVAVTDEETTDATTGIACFDGLPIDTTFTLRETTTPTGYATVDDQNVTTGSAHTECGDGNEVSVTIENTPLTDIDVSVTPQATNATFSRIFCTGPGPDGVLGNADDETLADTGFVATPVVDLNGLEPGDYNCAITIDP
jgi:uncharacterized repeat protein (TIGR01451 family)